MAKLRNIALLIESSRVEGRELLRGIGSYVREHEEWSIYYQERSLSDAAPAWLKKWRGDGIIARIESRRLAKQIIQMDLPTVDLRGRHHIEGVVAAVTNRGVTARAAAEHLLDCGFKHFAYCGLGGLSFSDERRIDFVEYLAEKGYDTSVHESPCRPQTFDTPTIEAKAMFHSDALKRWLQSLPKPVGMMACNDIRAQQVLSTCRTHGIVVPEDVAVIGADNDEVLCGLCVPSLSSIDKNHHALGYEAAVLLDRMMNGHRPAADLVLAEPARLVPRQSTDVLAIDDTDVRAALRFIRGHACEGIMVGDVLEHVSLSHATLKRRFAKLLGRPPKAEIMRVQLQRVKDVLATTDMPLAKIAELAGFRHVEIMCRMFKKKTTQTPGQYRAACRSGAYRDSAHQAGRK
ncbi:MAG: DNA-binding transcriptional regulator [Planctomycetota bacterium]|nr:DNA-binding transcriptional regulator [Planctomycetota bacterium]